MPARCVEKAAPLPIGSAVRLVDGRDATVELYAVTTDGGFVYWLKTDRGELLPPWRRRDSRASPEEESR